MSSTILIGIGLITVVSVIASIRISLRQESERLSVMESFDRANRASLRAQKKRQEQRSLLCK